jgi:hypothetical protein
MLDMFVGKTLPGWKCNGVTARKGDTLPPADLYVVDLAGAGLARWSQDAEADLLKLVGSGPAVLLTPAFDPSWSSGFDEQTRKKKSIVLLKKPYGTEDMRAALQKAHAGRAPALSNAAPVATGSASTAKVTSASSPGMAPFVQPVAKGSSPSAVFASTALGSWSSMSSMPQTAPTAETPTPADGGEFSAAQLRQHLEALPEPDRPRFLNMLADSLDDGRPFELRVTVNNAVIVDPVERWAASNTPILVMERLCRSDALASVVSFRVIDDEDPLVRAQRLGMAVQPLESFLWDVAHGVLSPKV